MKIELAGNYRAQWGEGPIWWEGALYYVDIENYKIIRFDPATGEEKQWAVGERVGTIVPRQGGKFVIAGDSGFYFFDDKSGGTTAINDPEPGKNDNRFNDGKCSPDGDFFAGTISLVKKEGDASLYRLTPELEVSTAYGPVTNSNGIVWSIDGRSVYYIDTPTKKVLAFDYEKGLMANPRKVIDTSEHDSSPDGMTIDENGNLWVAFCHGAMVICYDPKDGKELQRIDLPCMETTAVAFGGENLDELYVTTGVHKFEIEENSGRLFVVKGLGVKGVKASAFAG